MTMIRHLQIGLLALTSLWAGACMTFYEPPPEGVTPELMQVKNTSEDISTTDDDGAPPDKAPGLTSRTLSETQAGLGNALLAPLEDLNVQRAPIPELLLAIKNPYAVPADIDCAQLTERIEALNVLLGRDWDIPPPDKANLSERASDGASTAFLEAIASETSGLIPYRGIVRSLSGAKRHQTKHRKAYERGSHRRTFLKGLGHARGCAYPAAPQALPESEMQIDIDFR